MKTSFDNANSNYQGSKNLETLMMTSDLKIMLIPTARALRFINTDDDLRVENVLCLRTLITFISF